MTDIHIPPEAVEAAARACYEYWRDKDTTGALPPWGTERFMPFRDGWREQASAAILAALRAWPGVYANGLQKGWKHYTPALILPLPPQENPDAASK